MKLYVGNLPWSTTDDDLRALFSPYGEVTYAKVITDRETNRSRGFGFVEMDGPSGKAAMDALNDKEVDNRKIRVNEARERR